MASVRPDGHRTSIRLPQSGLIAMRLSIEHGPPEAFAEALERALARGGRSGATIVARLDSAEIAIHIPREDGPAWNCVPLVHLRAGDEALGADWAVANEILEKLERYR
jgi:hypothetical protein